MKVWIYKIMTFLFVIGAFGGSVNAQEIEDKELKEIQESLLSNFDFGEIDQVLEELYSNKKMNFSDTVRKIINGEMELDAETFNQLISDQITYAFRTNRKILVHIIVLVLFSAIFSNFTDVFQNKQISQIGFYVAYMLILAFSVRSFSTAIAWAQEGIGHLTAFMKALCPIFFLAVSIAKGGISSAAFYDLTLMIILAVELVILKIFIPAIQIYIMIKLLNCLSDEDYLSKLSELIHLGIGWGLKVLLAIVIGLNGVQALIAPAIDTVKRSTVTKGMEAIPGIGDALGGMTEVVLGMTVLIKNGIGVAGIIICIGICLTPLMQILLLTLLYKISAALVQPVADKRMVQCVADMGEGCMLIMKVILTVVVLFLVTIAIVSATTGKI